MQFYETTECNTFEFFAKVYTECNILEYFAEVYTECNIVPTVEGKVGVRVIKEWKKQKLG